MRNSFLNSISGFFGDVARANEAARTYDRLSAMSDVSLAARGLKRGNLAAAAYSAAFAKYRD